VPGLSICDVLPAAATLLGVPQATDALGLADNVGEVRRIVVVLIDGMGHSLAPGLRPRLASLISEFIWRVEAKTRRDLS